jgi:hypothetical protein
MKVPVPILSIPLIFSLCLGAIIMPENAIYPDANTHSTENSSNHNNGNVDDHHVAPRGVIDCKICDYVTAHLNTTLFNNPKVLSFVTADIQKICTVLPASLQNACNAEAVNIAPFVLEQIGSFIASEGCHDLGVCP